MSSDRNGLVQWRFAFSSRFELHVNFAIFCKVDSWTLRLFFKLDGSFLTCWVNARGTAVVTDQRLRHIGLSNWRRVLRGVQLFIPLYSSESKGPTALWIITSPIWSQLGFLHNCSNWRLFKCGVQSSLLLNGLHDILVRWARIKSSCTRSSSYERSTYYVLEKQNFQKWDSAL